MARVMPFRGLRYDSDVVGDWGSVLGPPYDIVDAAQTAALRSASPYQISHIEMASGDEEIAAAAQRLRDWRSAGAVVQDAQPCFYLHEHRFEANGSEQTRRAVFGAVELSDWGVAGVMAHERTMPGPKATRTALRSVVGADVSPLMAFVPDSEERLATIIDEVATHPALERGVDPSGDEHTLRVISDPSTVTEVADAFASQRIYMADGHHRYESALASRDQRPGSLNVLMGIVCASDPALAVGATHRVARVAAPPQLTDRLARSFRLQETTIDDLGAALPAGSASLGLVIADGVWTLEPSDAAFDAMPNTVPAAWRELAPALLQYAVFEPTFGIDADALASGTAVSYTHYLEEAVEAVRAGTASAAFILPAPTLEDVIDTADAGSFMPQKSTYFVPKLPTGLVLHPLD